MHERELSAIIDTAKALAAELGDKLVEADRRAQDWSSPLRSPGGPTPKNSVSDPTGATATARATIEDRYAASLERRCREFHRAALNLSGLVTEITAGPKELPDNSLAPCANPHGCPSEAWAERRGRCHSCYRYVRRHGRDRRKPYDRDPA